jgi:hypothetical protein
MNSFFFASSDFNIDWCLNGGNISVLCLFSQTVALAIGFDLLDTRCPYFHWFRQLSNVPRHATPFSLLPILSRNDAIAVI